MGAGAAGGHQGRERVAAGGLAHTARRRFGCVRSVCSPLLLNPCPTFACEQQAAGAADIVTVRELVQGRGVSVHVTHAQHGGTPLHMLCAWPEPDDEDAVAAALVLLQAGAHPRALAGNGSTPLHWAAGSGNTGLIKVLLEHGADPAATTYTWR